MGFPVTDDGRLKGNHVQIMDCRATVSDTKSFRQNMSTVDLSDGKDG